MTPEQFCLWLQGILEVNDHLSLEQIKKIEEKLQTVFQKETKILKEEKKVAPLPVVIPVYNDQNIFKLEQVYIDRINNPPNGMYGNWGPTGSIVYNPMTYPITSGSIYNNPTGMAMLTCGYTPYQYPSTNGSLTISYNGPVGPVLTDYSPPKRKNSYYDISGSLCNTFAIARPGLYC